MTKFHKFYPNCHWTVTHCWPNLTLDTVLLTKVYWSYSTHVVRVCFTPLLQPTLKRDLKRTSKVQITFNSPAMASLHELLCYHLLMMNMDELWMNSLLLFTSHDLDVILPQQFRPFYPKQQIVISTSCKF